jgi:hypothetical protein
MWQKTTKINSWSVVGPLWGSARLKVVFTLMFCNIICYVDRVNISIAIVEMSKDFGWDSVRSVDPTIASVGARNKHSSYLSVRLCSVANAAMAIKWFWCVGGDVIGSGEFGVFKPCVCGAVVHQTVGAPAIRLPLDADCGAPSILPGSPFGAYCGVPSILPRYPPICIRVGSIFW